MNKLFSTGLFRNSMHKFKTLPRPQNNSFHTLNLNICKTRKCNFGGFNQLNQFNIFLNPSQRRNFSIFNWRKKDEEDIINTPVIPPDNNSTKEEKEDENLMKALSKHIEISDLAKTPEVYKYLPIADHPLVPNYPIHLSVTKNQFDEFTQYMETFKARMFAASVVKNVQVFETEEEIATMAEALIPKIPKIKSIDDVYSVGAICEVSLKQNKGNTTIPYSLILFPVHRMRIKEVIEECNPFGIVKVENLFDPKLTESDLDMEQSVTYKYLKLQYLKCFDLASDPKFKAFLNYIEMSFNLNDIMQFINLSLTILSLPAYANTYKFLTKIPTENIQEVYEESALTPKLEKLNTLLSDFSNKLELWSGLENEFDFKKDAKKTQDKLEDIYKSLKEKFTSETDERIEQVKRFRANLEGKIVPEHAMKIIEEEIAKYSSMEKYHSESTISRTYLEYLTALPWGVTSKDRVDIPLAKQILDEGHYAMNDIKQRILELLAVGKLKDKVQGRILCFVGPPGVGKTSIGSSIAKAINRKFVRISVGGDKDTNTLKGFRRTYIGAIPGKIVQALKTTNTENPVILIDEIDKMGQRSAQGDPSSAMLEILDPEQNSSFTDDFLDIPIDLSKVLFICTANMLETIQPPLLDRMEVIKLSGYTHDEKRHIYQKYLKAEAITRCGLEGLENQFEVSDQTIEKLISEYCREPGVRSLQRYTYKILEKIALKIVQGETNIKVNEDNLGDYIGHPRFHSARIYSDISPPKGVVCGLAYNEYGGSILFIESTECSSSEGSGSTSNRSNSSKGGQLKVTGSLGEVMKESSIIAHTFVRNYLNSKLEDLPEYIKTREFLGSREVHIHFPEGAIPKDGPSAGVTIATAFISLALDTPVKLNTAMTGEITLNGKVLGIGGVKEKVMAASREGIEHLILPQANIQDYNNLPDFIKGGMKVDFASHYEDIFQIMFPTFRS